MENNWVRNCKTIYIGKAGGLNGNVTLKSRLAHYLKFRQGKNIGYYVGRLIWQLKNHLDLTFCWLPITDIKPRELEKKILADFIQQYGQRQFANLMG